YAHLSDAEFRAGRATMLGSLLQRPHIFTTRWGQAREADARANITRLLAEEERTDENADVGRVTDRPPRAAIDRPDRRCCTLPTGGGRNRRPSARVALFSSARCSSLAEPAARRPPVLAPLMIRHLPCALVALLTSACGIFGGRPETVLEMQNPPFGGPVEVQIADSSVEPGELYLRLAVHNRSARPLIIDRRSLVISNGSLEWPATPISKPFV